ncbi:MAG TPA: NlpC/P60 family protein [Actinomycetota bacterium]|nr:NlpC/P60 family protein [Actinomycetota bacterium]
MRRRLGAILSLLLVASLVPATRVDAAPSRANLQKEVDSLTTQISTLDEDFNHARIQLSRAERQMRELGIAKEEANRELAELRRTASQRAAASYRIGMPNMILALFGAESFNDFSRRMGISSRVGDWESGIVTELEIANNRSQEKEAQLRKERDRAKALSSSISQKRTALQQRVNQHEALMARVAAEERARAARAAATSARGAAPARPLVPLLRQEPKIEPPPLSGSGNARAAIAAGYSKIGTPYSWGASGPGAFDCSGFTSYAWRAAGVSLPHSSRAQYAATKRVSRDDLQPGDLVFFGSPIHHVGMYVGGGNMLDASTYGRPVAVRSINRRGYVGAGRPGV